MKYTEYSVNKWTDFFQDHLNSNINTWIVPFLPIYTSYIQYNNPFRTSHNSLFPGLMAESAPT